jgi:hypothetical protein
MRVLRILFPIIIFAFLVWVDFKYYGPKSVPVLSVDDIKTELEIIKKLNTEKDYSGFQKPKEILGIFNNREVIKTYFCFGDLCPQNGGYALMYSGIKSEAECLSIGGKPIVGIGWGRVYAGCSPKLEEEGQIFKTTRGNTDLIKLINFIPNQKISSPLTIKGYARGTWFFEASFPVFITNWDGVIISKGIAQAEGDWMTEDFVPFSATLNFDQNQVYSQGFLILKKDNPSGLSEHDDTLEIPVTLELVK